MSSDHPEPLKPAQATKYIQGKVCDELELALTKHAKEQLQNRDLVQADIFHILRFGYVHDAGQATNIPGIFKYRMECTTPNSGNRIVRIVVIPSMGAYVKIITVMWADEPMTGS